MTNFDVNTLPHSREAESAVIGSVLVYPAAYYEAAKYIRYDDFYIVRNKEIWQAFEHLTRTHVEIDILTVSSYLESKNQEVDQNYLIELISSTPTAMHAEHYAVEVGKFSSRRRALQAANELAKAAYNSEQDIEQFIPKYVTSLLDMIKTENRTMHIRDILSKVYDDVEYRYKNPQEIYGIPTGIAGIDKLTGGLQKGELFLLSGEPGVGKSLLAMQIAFHMAKSDRPGVIYELEMSGIQTLRRTLSVESGVGVRNMKTGQINDGQWYEIIQAIQRMEAYPAYFSDSTSWNTASLRADLVRMKQLYSVEWFVVDYLRLLKDKFDGKEPERIGIICSCLHDICKDLDIGCIAIQSMTKEGMRDGGLTGVYGGSEQAHAADIIALMTKTEKRSLDNAEMVNLKFEKFRESDSDTNLVQLVKKPGFPAFGELAKSSYSK